MEIMKIRCSNVHFHLTSLSNGNLLNEILLLIYKFSPPKRLQNKEKQKKLFHHRLSSKNLCFYVQKTHLNAFHDSFIPKRLKSNQNLKKQN